MARRTIDMLRRNMRVKRGLEQVPVCSRAIQTLVRNQPEGNRLSAYSIVKHMEGRQMKGA